MMRYASLKARVIFFNNSGVQWQGDRDGLLYCCFVRIEVMKTIIIVKV